jgi:predicted ATPase/class 3 adenylate cyclase
MMGMEFPAGTMTFLFTDMEGSTRNWESSPIVMKEALERHDILLADGIRARGGTIVTERGEGDSFFAIFAYARDAVAAACSIQLALQAESWPGDLQIRVRMAIHTAVADPGRMDYRGPEVNRCARIRSIAHGGQVLLSSSTEALVSGRLPVDISLQDLGEHRLRDLTRPAHIFQLNHPKLPSQFPPLQSLSVLKHNLPVQLTSFVGREEQLKDVQQLLGTHRLVTLTGAGGCGKTRLALQAGAESLESYADGVWHVDLAPLAETDLIPKAVAESLGVREEADHSLAKALGVYLRDKQLLLLLDNCEHLLDACASLAQELLNVSAGLRILATSREALNITGEAIWRVPSLSLPDLEGPSSHDAAIASESVRLFVDRATASQSSFTLTPPNSSAVARICQQLDGIPLAIELAASRVRLMTPDQILDRLKDRFQLLTGGGRTNLARQQTLQATFDWSYYLLVEAEKRLFRWLSVFSGGFDLEGVEEVCASADLSGEPTLELFFRLFDKSLVTAELEGDRLAPYRLLETTRQYAHEKLRDTSEETAAREGHLRCFLGLAESAYAQRMDTPAEWLARLERDHDNLRSALEWSRHHHPDQYLRLAGALGWFWYSHSHLEEGRAHLAAALAGQHGRTRIVARALWGAATLATWQGHTAAGRHPAEESLAIWRELGDELEVALTLYQLGWTEAQGDPRKGLDRFQESLDILSRLGNPTLVNRARLGVCQALVMLGEIDTAEAMAREALVVASEQQDVRHALHLLGDCALIRGDVGTSTQRYGESLRAAVACRDEVNATFEMQGVAMSMAGQSRPLKALRLDEAAMAHRKALGVQMTIPFWEDLKEVRSFR